jgi:hypothetical protein
MANLHKNSEHGDDDDHHHQLDQREGPSLTFRGEAHKSYPKSQNQECRILRGRDDDSKRFQFWMNEGKTIKIICRLPMVF